MISFHDKTNQSEIVLYQTEDGETKIQVRLENETVWLTQSQMAELFQTSIPNVSMHIRNIFREGELQEESVVKDFLTTAADEKRYRTSYFNLDVIISVGYRVKSHRGTQFRIWATQRLREHIIKGFTLDDERLKQGGGGNYFDELLARRVSRCALYGEEGMISQPTGSSRRDFLAKMGGAAMAAGLPQVPGASGIIDGKPNILFIAIDDLNDWIGCLGGHPDIRTPNMDRLARRGVLFTNAHCPAPLCNASRAALLTGVRPSTSGVYTNSQPMRQSESLRGAVTLPQYFMSGGYRVMGGGKIFHDAFPDPQSWQEYFPSPTRPRPVDPLPPNRPLNGIPNAAHFDWGPMDVSDSQMGDSKVTSWAAGELVRPQPGPFFLACGLFRPHLPWYVPRKYFDLYPAETVTLPNVKDDDLDDVPPIGHRFAKPDGDHRKVIQHGQWRKAVQGYLASITFADACVGRVLDALEAGPHADNTVIVLWSDHGWHLGEKLHWRKFALWEEATHNVLMVVAPGTTQPAGRCNRTVNLMDIYPTLIELCALPMKKGIEGVSLLPLLKNPRAEWNRPSVTTYLRDNHSVRGERWRYIRYNDGTEELYDHSKDELEWNNLAGKPEFNKIKTELARWLPKINAPDAPSSGVTPEGEY